MIKILTLPISPIIIQRVIKIETKVPYVPKFQLSREINLRTVKVSVVHEGEKNLMTKKRWRRNDGQNGGNNIPDLINNNSKSNWNFHNTG